MTGELVAISSSEELRDVVRESFFLVGRGTSSTTTGWLSRTMNTRMRQTGRYITTCAVVAASGFNKVTEFGFLSSQSVGWLQATSTTSWVLIPSVKLCAAATEIGPPRSTVILDSVGYGISHGYRDGSAALYCDP